MERELFAAETVNERLVREAIQNSLDAGLARADRSTGAPVRVRFSLQGVREPLDGVSAFAYVDGLEEHLVQGLDPSDDFRRSVALRGLANAGMQYLVVEDTGTFGLEGDWRQFDDSEAERADDNHFYWFFRNVGRSGKSDEDGGSWGLGKWVFPDASHASAYIAVTRRRSDGETLLMGQAVLTKHNVDGERYAPYGYFGEVDDHELALPLRMSEPAHRPFIQQFIADFGLRFRDEPGLSVVVPFPRVDGDAPISRGQMLAAIVHNYFYPIIAGRLEVTVDEGGDSVPTEVACDTIDDVLSHLDLDDSGERSMGSYQRLFDMCRDSATLPERSHIELKSPPRNGPDYEHHAALAALRRQYDEGQLLAFRIGTTVERKGAAAKEPSSFRLYIEHDGALTQGHDFYVRGALSVSAMNLIERHHARALLVVDEEEPLAAMLRDSEPPAHTAWNPQSDRVSKRWVSPRNRINEIRTAAGNLISIWESAPVELQRDALADIFPSGAHGGRRRKGAQKGSVGPNPVPDDLPPGHPDFNVEQYGTGFRVRLVRGKENPPDRVRLSVAYEVPRGNPMASYSPHDFRLLGPDALDVRVSGCRVREGEGGNEALLNIDDPQLFSVTVQGFDTRRDVIARVDKAPDATQESGAGE